MAHFNRTQGSWPNGFIPDGADFDDLDSKTERAINGDEGGTWAPSAEIEIGGSGLHLASGSVHKVSGTLRTLSAGALELAGGAGDWIEFKDAAGVAAPRTRTRLHWMNPPGPQDGWNFRGEDVMGTGSASRLYMPLERLQDGATLTNVRLRVWVRAGHAGLPTQRPRLGVFKRTALLGVEDIPLNPAGHITMPFALLPPDFTEADYNDYETFIDCPCTADNVVDTNALYFASIYDESGTNALDGNIYRGLELTYSVPDLRWT